MKRFLVPFMVLALLTGGCATTSTTSPGTSAVVQQDSPQVVAYKSLRTAGQTYDATMKAMADLYRQKIIDDAVKARAIEYGRSFKVAYNVAIDILEKGGTPDLTMVTDSLMDLVNLIQPYMAKAKGGK